MNNPLRFVDPLGLDVTITRWRCCGGADHIGIGVGAGMRPTVGVYPRTPHTPFDDGVVAWDHERQPSVDLLDASIDFRDVIVLRTTDEQDQRIQAYIDARRRRPGRYNLAGRNCGNFVQDALAAGGIEPVGPVGVPGAFFEMLKAMNQAGVDFTRGVERRP